MTKKKTFKTGHFECSEITFFHNLMEKLAKCSQNIFFIAVCECFKTFCQYRAINLFSSVESQGTRITRDVYVNQTVAVLFLDVRYGKYAGPFSNSHISPALTRVWRAQSPRQHWHTQYVTFDLFNLITVISAYSLNWDKDVLQV